MYLPRLDLCCCGYTIKTGTLVILGPSLILSILNLFAGIGSTIISAQEQGRASSPPHPSELFCYFLTCEYTDVLAADIITILGITISIIRIVVVIIAIHGVEKGLHSYLVPFLIWLWIDFIITMVVYSLSVLSSDPRVIPVLSSLIAFLLVPYFWLVVYTHYRDMKEPPTASSSE